MQGVVSEFDERRGLGTVTGDDGAAYPFHAVNIADGTRRIGIGAKVDFAVVPGNLGRWEAATLTPR
jgi:cold shock CspA family protein